MTQRGGARPGAGRKPGKISQAKRDIQAAAKGHAEKALQALVNIAESGESEAARVSAANSILDRGYGRPTQAVQHGGEVTVKTLADFYAEANPADP